MYIRIYTHRDGELERLEQEYKALKQSLHNPESWSSVNTNMLCGDPNTLQYTLQSHHGANKAYSHSKHDHAHVASAQSTAIHNQHPSVLHAHLIKDASTYTHQEISGPWERETSPPSRGMKNRLMNDSFAQTRSVCNMYACLCYSEIGSSVAPT
jgi:hypothetical protein